MNTLLIGLAGGSGSGKSWLTRRFQRWFPGQVAVLRLDDFYRDQSALPAHRRDRVNFDDPDALDWPLLEACLKAIQRQETCCLPRYEFTTHTRHPKWRRWRPRPLVVVEGLWPLKYSRLRSFYHWSIFIDAPESLCLARRLERDVRERGRSRASVLRQYRQQVMPMHRRHVAPQAAYADEVVGHAITPDTLAHLRKTLKDLLQNGSSGQ